MRLPDLTIHTPSHTALVEITGEVRAALKRSGLQSGLIVVYVPHTTAAVTVQENADPAVKDDLLLALENAVPERASRGVYHHSEGNSAAHVKASLLGSSATLLVRDGELVLGTWQGIELCEFDGPRARTVHLEAIAG